MPDALAAALIDAPSRVAANTAITVSTGCVVTPDAISTDARSASACVPAVCAESCICARSGCSDTEVCPRSACTEYYGDKPGAADVNLEALEHSEDRLRGLLTTMGASA